MERASWIHSKGDTEKLTELRKDGYIYSLPSEAQWEYGVSRWSSLVEGVRYWRWRIIGLERGEFQRGEALWQSQGALESEEDHVSWEIRSECLQSL